MRLIVLAGVVVSLLGCGGEDPATVPRQADLTGAWVTSSGPAGCVFAVSFAGAIGTYAAGISCAVPGAPPNVDHEGGAFTLDRAGRINFLASESSCAGNRVTTAEYGGAASRPTIALASPPGMVLASSSSSPFPDDAAVGCFASDWSFALR